MRSEATRGTCVKKAAERAEYVPRVAHAPGGRAAERASYVPRVAQTQRIVHHLHLATLVSAPVVNLGSWVQAVQT